MFSMSKKFMRKFTSLLFAFCLILSLTANAFAAGDNNGTNKTITINNAKSGHTYQAYQIFTGDLDGSALSNIVWGSNVDTTKLTTANGFTSDVAKTIAKDMSATNADAYAQKFAKVLTGSPAGTTNTQSENKYVISGLKQGYYLVRDVDTSQNGKHDAETFYICRITTDNLTVTPKSEIPSVEKKVKDNETGSTWADSADYNIGDDVPFQLTATLSTDTSNHGFSDYEKYALNFVDTLSTGLTSPTNALTNFDVYFGTYKLTADDKTTVGMSVEVSGQSLKVKFTNIKALTGTNKATAGSKVIVEYKAKLNANAVIGSAGNDNKVKLQYSNNPNSSGTEGLGETPEDKVKVFTYKLKITKLNENDQALSGAVFHLEKKNAQGTYVTVAAPIKINTTNNIFTVEGIDAGDYKLVEDTSPNGYSKIEPVEFTVSATHGDGDDPQLTALSASVTNSSSISTGSIGSFTCTPSTGEIASTVKDEKGISLPGTGGMGVYIFYAIGAALIAGFGIKKIADRKK